MPEEIEEEKCKKKRCQGGPRPKHGAVAGLQTLQSNEQEDGASDEEENEVPPLHVFFDVEAMQPQERHMPNLIVAEKEDDERPIRFKGEHCVPNFIEWLNTLTRDDTHQVNILAHNFQGYDGYFIVHEYHGQNRILKQLQNGAKLLEVVTDNIYLIHSMSFFQMLLAAFPKTFRLTELKKGYFPHKFNIPEHQDYVGEVTALDYYMPENKSSKDL